MERRLRLAVVAYVGGARPSVSCVEAAEAISAQLDIPRHRFSVHHFQMEEFLIVFATPELHNIALRDNPVDNGSFKLFIKSWLRQAQASLKIMRVQVTS